VNHLFQTEATKRLRIIQKPIVLNVESRIRSLLSLKMSREALNLTPFPLSAVQVNLDFRRETLERFSRAFGHHINRYSFRMLDRLPGNSVEISRNAAMVLSHSPQLIELKLRKLPVLHLTDEDLQSLPNSFPALLVLEASENYNIFGREYPNPLIDLLVSRALNLKKLKVPWDDSITSLRILRFIAENRPNKLPHISLYIWNNRGHKAPVPEILSLKLICTEVYMSVMLLRDEGPDRVTVREMASWLESQSNSLTDLHMLIYSHRHGQPVSVSIPFLPKLRKLTITFPGGDGRDLTMPFLPFVGNPFPALQKLALDDDNGHNLGVFNMCIIPSVLELRLRYSGIFITNPSWSTSFPNMTTLHAEFYWDLPEAFRSTLRFIFTNLTCLEHLNIDFPENLKRPVHNSYIANSSWDSWDLLTGEVPPSFRETILSDQETVYDFGVEEEPVSGVYQEPSLRNMRSKSRELRSFFLRKSNMEFLHALRHHKALI